MKFFRVKKQIDVTINNEFTSNGIEISILKNGSTINIPFNFSIGELKQLDILDELQIIEDLYAAGQLEVGETGKYILSYEQIYKFETEERELLQLPIETTPISVKLENEQFVGGRDFNFIPVISSKDIKNLHLIGERKGAVIKLPSNEVILLEKEFHQFLELVDQEPPRDNVEKLMSHVAEVRKEAINLGVELNSYIQNEDYTFIDELDIELERNDSGIKLVPHYKHEDLDTEILDDLAASKVKYTKHANQRILVKDKVAIASDKVKEQPIIENKDIPKFVQNPTPFYNEDIGISLEDFSDRVKKLNIRVYQAQPFLHANQNERGWFEYESGFKIKDVEGNEILSEHESFFEGNEDEFKQIDDNTFIEIPDQVKEFQDLTKKMKEETKTQQPNSLSKYVLEIFENFNQVEYNKPLSMRREELQNERFFDATPPKGFNATLKPFQEDGFKWMKRLRAIGNGGLLADDMGLGKTIQVIAYLLYLKELGNLTPTLIVLPKTLIENWQNEIYKFAPILADSLYIHRNADRLKDSSVIEKFDLVLTTYATLARDQLILGKIDWEMVICDEAQAIKNPSTANSTVIKALKNKGRLALTGTPVENNMTELWSIIDFVQPGLFGSLKDFRSNYEKRLKDEQAYEEVQADLEEKMRFVYLRRTKLGELKGQLPDKFIVKNQVGLGKVQKRLYQQVIDYVKNEEMSGLVAIQRLKMLCSHPGLVDASFRDLSLKEVPKLQKTMELIASVKEKNEKVIIFTEYRQMQSIIKKEIINSFGINALIINGATGHRQGIVDEFNRKPGFDVLILSPKAAGTGLTITGANHVIHYTRWWNPAVENQATDRVYRIGQDKDVQVYYPIVGDDDNNRTVENIIDELLEEKKALADNVIVPSKSIDIENEVFEKLMIS